MKRTSAVWLILWLAIACSTTTSARAQLFAGLGKTKGLPQIAVATTELPPLANPAYGEVLLSGNEALLEPGWLIGSLRDAATGQILKWNNYLRPDAKPNVKLLTEPMFEGFVDHSAVAKAEWLSALKGQMEDRAVAEVVVTRVSVTSVEPKQIDRQRLISEIVQRLPPEQQGRYGVVIAYVDVAITATRFQHHEVDGDFAGYGGRIGGEWYYKDKQKLTEHRLVAISAPLQFAVTAFNAPSGAGAAAAQRPCQELVYEAIKQGKLTAEKPGLTSVACYSPDSWPIAGAPASSPGEDFVRRLFAAGGGSTANIVSDQAPPAMPAGSSSVGAHLAAAEARRAAAAREMEGARQRDLAAAEKVAARQASADASRRVGAVHSTAAIGKPHSWSADAASSSSSSSRALKSYKAEQK